jgi:aspartyl-tRNA(Asn)/glutamyl-tRNA(Gln) amidotransferase subunit B
MFKTGIDPSHIIEKHDLAQVSDEGELEKIVQEVIKENPQPSEDYKKGKEASLQFLVGQAMRKTKGKANPKVVSELLRKKLLS